MAFTVVIVCSLLLTPVISNEGMDHEQLLVIGFEEWAVLTSLGSVKRVDERLRQAVVLTRLSADDVRASPGVRFAEENKAEITASSVGPDRFAHGQIEFDQVRAPEAFTSNDTLACLLDTGINLDHEDLATARVVAVRSFVGTQDVLDDNGHGTATGGVLVATRGNSVGIRGLADLPIAVGKVLDRGGTGTLDALASGIAWCADLPARHRIIGMSLGAVDSSIAVQEAIDYASSKGSLLVAAVGNTGPCESCVQFPARDPRVVGVGCSTSIETRCVFSSEGAGVAIVAPGQDILTLGFPGRDTYTRASGTSMSVPFVIAAAAQVWDYDPNLDARAIRDRLVTSAQNLSANLAMKGIGAGEIDFECALAAQSGCLFESPSAPENMTVAAGPRLESVIVSWEHSVVPRGSRVQAYVIEARGPTGDFHPIGNVSGKVTTFHDATVGENVVREYQVKARSSGGDSNMSVAACIGRIFIAHQAGRGSC